MDSPDGLTIVSPKLIDFPALCAECGEPTPRTVSVAIDTGGLRSYTYLLYFLPIPFKEILLAALESGGGPKNTKIPVCETCARPFKIAGYKTAGIIVAALALPALFLWSHWLAPWITGLALAAALIVMLALAISRIRQGVQLPVTITREKKEYIYHFHAGIYRALAEREGFTLADLTPPPKAKLAHKPG